MQQLRNYLDGQWVGHAPMPRRLVNPATEEDLAEMLCAYPDHLEQALTLGRNVGNPTLQEMSFGQRGEILAAMSKVIREHRPELVELSVVNGGKTPKDASFDIDGASYTLSYYSKLARELPEGLLLDGTAEQLTKSGKFVGQHVWMPLPGVAVLINAFNFPAWGIAEKAACAILAGMPVIAKPASATALVAHRLAQLWVEAKIFPNGVFQFLLGGSDLLDYLNQHDVIAFTGSRHTARFISSHECVEKRRVCLRVEADSLNAAILGPDVQPGSATFSLFCDHVVQEMTHMSGQKCTAFRRIIVPIRRDQIVLDALADRLSQVKVGNPAQEGVTMGPLTTAEQFRKIKELVQSMEDAHEVVRDSRAQRAFAGVPDGKGFFLEPTILQCDQPRSVHLCHELELFGPIVVLMPYNWIIDANDLAYRGRGGLLAAIYSDEPKFVAQVVRGVGPDHGRVYLGNATVAADDPPSPGTVLPQLTHGGPGRAGGGPEELGGIRGLHRYMNRVALQGDPALIEAVVRSPAKQPTQ